MSSAPTLAPEKTEKKSLQLDRLVVVGGGMASYGLCSRLVDRGLHEQYAVTVFGEEPRPAYDRVNLSKFFSGHSAEDLLLAPREWYDEHRIRLETDRRIVRIDSENKLVVDSFGRSEEYNQLVLATGSYPWLPPIPGADVSGVFAYRTIEDLEAIRDFVTSRGAKSSAVIGGGLLGLEAAKVMLDLGVKTAVIEMAPGLMPRQLDAGGAKVLREQVERLGVDVQLTRRTSSIEEVGERLRIEFQNAEALEVDIVVVAAGIRPRDELAKDAGLEVGARGGFAVNRRLQTSDSSIFAIGECASFEDYTYGLVAPCYRMADILANRLAGQESEFSGADESAELKLLGVPVTAIGRSLGLSTGGVVIKNEDETGYRKLILEQGRVAGATSVGEWEDLDSVRIAVGKQQRLWPHQRRRFLRSGRISPEGGSLHVGAWPSDATVCSCLGITRGKLSDAVKNGATTFESLREATSASTACGSCQHLIRQAVGEQSTAEAIPGAMVVLGASIISLVLSILILVLPPIPFSESVQEGWRQIDMLWRDSIAKQISGYSLVGITLVGLLFSLRKRTKLLKLGSYGLWRTIHVVLGVAILLAVVVHTGFRLGVNLNLALSCTFLTLTLVGALAGIASSLESRCSPEWVMTIRAWRPRLTRWHIWLFWPLPILIAAHIFCVYWY